MNVPVNQPNVTVDIINITDNTKGFRFFVQPIEQTGDITNYTFYIDKYNIKLEPNSNTSDKFIQELQYKDEGQYFYYIPNNTGLYYIAGFCKNSLGIESTGVLYSGIIPVQQIVREVSIKNLNCFTPEIQLTDGTISGGMLNIGQLDYFETRAPYCYVGFDIDYSSPTTQEVRDKSPNFLTYDFTSFFREKVLDINYRVIPAIDIKKDPNSGVLLDYSFLKNLSGDVYSNTSTSFTPEITESAKYDLNIQKLPLSFGSGQNNIINPQSRYFVFDYTNNYQSYLGANTIFTDGTDNNGTDLFNPEYQSAEEYSGTLNLVVSGVLPLSALKKKVQVSLPGFYNSYYLVIEATDEEFDSSAGGNIKDNTSDRYSNKEGYSILRVQHNSISRSKVLQMFKNYYRKDNKLIFDFKDGLPQDEGIDSIVILPFKNEQNLQNPNTKEYFDQFILLKYLDRVSNLKSDFNYTVELIDSQNEAQVRLTTSLSPDSPLLNSKIFSARIYYLNSLEAHTLDLYLRLANYSTASLINFLSSTSLIDKYIVLNKFINDDKDYTSTVAASYQGVVYFFTPESFHNIAWPNQDYCIKNFKSQGARMLDFDADGIATGPQFFDYFPRAQAEINGQYPQDEKYKTSYRCLDSYKYSTNSNDILILQNPENVPSSGINGSPEFLGAYDPGNIGDQDSPAIPDFKSVRNDLGLFASKNIYSVKVLKVGTQKDDMYSIIEFVLDMPDAEDFIVQGISGTDMVLEKGIKNIDGVSYHYFIAKFVSSCGIEEDPKLYGFDIDKKSILDSKKIISFVVYPTAIKIVEDEIDVPYFSKFYLLATDLENNQFNILKNCTYTLLENNTDCKDTCCVDPSNPIVNRAPKAEFYILSKYIDNQQSLSHFPQGRIYNSKSTSSFGGTTVIEADAYIDPEAESPLNKYERRVFGSTQWHYIAKNSNSTGKNILLFYQKPNPSQDLLHLAIACYPEHNISLKKIIISVKTVNNGGQDVIAFNNYEDPSTIKWSSSDIVDIFNFENTIKNYPIIFSIPDFSFSNSTKDLFNAFLKDYSAFTVANREFAIKISLIDRNNDKKEQTFIFLPITASLQSTNLYYQTASTPSISSITFNFDKQDFNLITGQNTIVDLNYDLIGAQEAKNYYRSKIEYIINNPTTGFSIHNLYENKISISGINNTGDYYINMTAKIGPTTIIDTETFRFKFYPSPQTFSTGVSLYNTSSFGNIFIQNNGTNNNINIYKPNILTFNINDSGPNTLGSPYNGSIFKEKISEAFAIGKITSGQIINSQPEPGVLFSQNALAYGTYGIYGDLPLSYTIHTQNMQTGAYAFYNVFNNKFTGTINILDIFPPQVAGGGGSPGGGGGGGSPGGGLGGGLIP